MVLTVIIVFDMSLMQRKFTNILFSEFINSSRMPTFKIKESNISKFNPNLKQEKYESDF